MPTEKFYTNDVGPHDDAGFVRLFAEHHYEPDNRHISRYEYERLIRLAAKLERREQRAV
jgi:hypothetical protein